jgi:putative AdoMet-dependent methyltransferase
MRSLHVDRFNHDADAAGYDDDVRDETDPIRAGYAELLRWVAGEAAVRAGDRVMDLGSGTGNLTALLGPAREIVCVDVSREMSSIARDKLAASPWASSTPCRFVEADLLEAFEVVEGDFDVVASSYAVHHLTGDEKAALFASLRARLSPGGRAVFGDLMFESAAAQREALSRLRAAGDADSIELASTIEDEFFWDLERATSELRHLGLAVRTRRFSELSWGVAATLPP